MTSPDWKVLASEYAGAWSSQDPARVASYFAEDGSLRVNDDAPAVGRAAITEIARGFMTAFPDMIVTCDKLIRRPGGGLEFHWTLVGSNTGPDGTGKAVRISGHEEWRMSADGRITESEGHFDAAEYARQLEHGVGA